MAGGPEQDVRQWNEDDSATFIDLGRYFVPQRETQISTIRDLIPPPLAGERLVELCSGEGLLSRALLEAFGETEVLALDGSDAMRAKTRETAGPLVGRLETRAFDLAAQDWRRFDEPVRAFVSSLAIHHLDGAEKQALFRDLHAALVPGGALLIADLIAPASRAGWRLAAHTWEAGVRERGQQLDGDGEGVVALFNKEGWNFFADPDPDPMDKPSPLADQLDWLRAAGFTGVDVFWMTAGHAIYGGFKPGA